MSPMVNDVEAKMSFLTISDQPLPLLESSDFDPVPRAALSTAAAPRI
jgi:hypothetical protein